jgi:hypothetical protein
MSRDGWTSALDIGPREKRPFRSEDLAVMRSAAEPPVIEHVEIAYERWSGKILDPKRDWMGKCGKGGGCVKPLDGGEPEPSCNEIEVVKLLRACLGYEAYFFTNWGSIPEGWQEWVRRVGMGKKAKARKGHVLGAGPGGRYGFRRVRNGKGKVVGYEPIEAEMRIVRRILGWLAEGRSLYHVQTTLEAEGVPAPRGGDRWHRPTVKDIVNEDSYLPHTPKELKALVAEGLLAEEVFAGLDPERPYGINYYGRTRSSYVSTRSKKRKVEPTPRSEWVAIPLDLSGTGLTREQVERARASIADNRATARVGDRECWELSRGFLFCGECGRAMSASARRDPQGGPPTSTTAAAFGRAAPTAPWRSARTARGTGPSGWSTKPPSCSTGPRARRPSWSSTTRRSRSATGAL